MKTLLKNFAYGLLPYIILGLIVALLIGANIVHTLMVIVAMVAFNITVNVSREVIEKREKIQQIRKNVARFKK